MIYDALDIAEYILNYCETELHNPINNLRLQKLLYIIQIEFIKETSKPIFYNTIEAWNYGTVIPDVYYWFNEYISDVITDISTREGFILDKNSKSIVDKVINDTKGLSTEELIKITKNTQPYKDNYMEDDKCEIPIYDLMDCYRGRR